MLAKAKERGLDRSIKELDTRDKEIATREMMVKKILRSKEIEANYKKLKKEMAV